MPNNTRSAIAVNSQDGYGRSGIGDWLRRHYIVNTIYFVLLITTYRILLDQSYASIAGAYGYQALFLNARTWQSQFLSWLLFFAAIPMFKSAFDERSVSGNIVSILVLFSIIPTITAVSFRSDYEPQYIFLVCLYWVVFLFSWKLFKIRIIESLTQIESQHFYKIVAVILCASVFIYSYINTGVRLHFDIIDVYDLRAEARNFIAPFPLNYIVSLADNILPFFAIYSIYNKKYFMASIILLFIYVNFSITGTKQILFTFFAGFIGFYFVRNLSSSYRIIVGAILLLLYSYIENRFFNSGVVSTLFSYRVLFIPAELHHNYFVYFQSNDFLYFSQSLLKWINSDSRQENIQFLLGEFAIGDFTARANNGLFSDAYMNFGIAGVLIFPAVVAFLLRIIDGASIGLSERLFFVIVIYVGFVLLGMTLTSALLTSGLLFLVFFLYSLPRSRLGRM